MPCPSIYELCRTKHFAVLCTAGKLSGSCFQVLLLGMASFSARPSLPWVQKAPCCPCFSQNLPCVPRPRLENLDTSPACTSLYRGTPPIDIIHHGDAQVRYVPLSGASRRVLGLPGCSLPSSCQCEGLTDSLGWKAATAADLLLAPCLTFVSPSLPFSTFQAMRSLPLAPLGSLALGLALPPTPWRVSSTPAAPLP